jgi:hypothetical protein
MPGDGAPPSIAHGAPAPAVDSRPTAEGSISITGGGLVSRLVSTMTFGYFGTAPAAPAAEASAAAAALTAAAPGAGKAAPAKAAPKRHLVVFVNGLTGAASNWDYLVSQVCALLAADGTTGVT